MSHSEILASLTLNKNQNIVAWIGKTQCIEGCFRKISNITTYFRVVGKLSEKHFRYCCSPISGTRLYKEEKLQKNSVSYFEQELGPWIEERQYIEILIRQFSNHPDICGIVGKISEIPFNVTLYQFLITFYDARISECARYKLDRVGPVDNRPSTDQFQHFVKKKLYMYDM